MLGSSLAVFPAAHVPRHARRAGAALAIVNLEPTPLDGEADLGLRVATVDLGGWDTHENQGDGSGGYLANNQLAPLGQGLSAFYTDLSNVSCGQDYTRKLTLVVMSEFGRRLKENANHGTDHGHGNAMFVMGGHVNGGHVYGNWPNSGRFGSNETLST